MRRVRSLAALPVAAVLAACGAVESETRDETRSLQRYGISVTLPDGWHGRLTRGTFEAATVPLGERVQQMPLGPDDVVVRLFEFEADPEFFEEVERTHHEGMPKPFTSDQFEPPEPGGHNSVGRGYARRNFALAGRTFDLFAEVGAPDPSAEVVASLNDLVASLEVRAGDFYPGTVEPPRFPATAGWHVGRHGAGDVRVTDYAQAWASTVPYRNEPRDLPPASTLETLPRDGILIWLGVARDNRFPPTDELRDAPRVSVPLQLGETHGGPGWEGQVRDLSLYQLFGRVDGEYDINLWVFYGRPEPSPEQRAAAQAMLDGLVLPDWGAWELDGRGANAVEMR